VLQADAVRQRTVSLQNTLLLLLRLLLLQEVAGPHGLQLPQLAQPQTLLKVVLSIIVHEVGRWCRCSGGRASTHTSSKAHACANACTKPCSSHASSKAAEANAQAQGLVVVLR
ncbi:hypothetical protein COO60DRAFT_1492629, partial [Scenedesmus sp. NREL 46B-D3]